METDRKLSVPPVGRHTIKSMFKGNMIQSLGFEREEAMSCLSLQNEQTKWHRQIRMLCIAGVEVLRGWRQYIKHIAGVEARCRDGGKAL